MKTFFYPRLALSNIKKNAQIYLPYLITSSFTVMMFYVIHSLAINEGLKSESSNAPVVLQLGTYVVMIFSVIFLFYLNSFLMKRRKKEIALYNILGMEKKHVMIMMFYETLFTTLFSLVVGVMIGALLSKLMFLLLVKLTGLNTQIFFEIPIQTVLFACTVYVSIFLIAYLVNVIHIKMTNPIELLKGGQTGEKEPRTKILMTIIGIVTLGSGYYIAQTIQEPISALLLFFVAVVLVIIGTYCLFTAGSIVILKSLKKNKRYYYQTRHFTSISQMIYRMKQNAVGLASICILCTCILVMISSTVSLYLGIEDSVKIVQDESYRFAIYLNNEDSTATKRIEYLNQRIQNELAEQQIQSVYLERMIYDISCVEESGQFKTGGVRDIPLTLMTLDEYNRVFHQNKVLKDNEILWANDFHDEQQALTIDDHSFQVKEVIYDNHILVKDDRNYEKNMTIVFANEDVIHQTFDNDDLDLIPFAYISIDFADKDEKVATQTINDIIDDEWKPDAKTGLQYYSCARSSQYDMKVMMQSAYGSLFFLGIFLGILFLMAAILIMYYKQLSEGYEDQHRFEIMQNVGMSKKEVKQTIRSQVLIFFFLPLIVAVIHMAFAFKMIVQMFSYLLVSKQSLFVWCTAISVVILAVIYSIVYSLTAKTYYKIVKN